MIYTKIYLPLAKDEFEAIEKLADRDLRGFREQVRFLLRDVLIERGVLTPNPNNEVMAKAAT